jgi:flagellin-like protein
MERRRGSSELISTVILVAVVLAMSVALWSYAQNSTAQLRDAQQVQSMLSQSSTNLNLLLVYSDQTGLTKVLQVSFPRGSNVYVAVLGLKGNSFLLADSPQSQSYAVFIPSGGPPISLSDSTQWSPPPNFSVQSGSVMVQPIYASDPTYYSIDLWLGATNLRLYKLDFSSNPVILLKTQATGQYTEVLVFFLQIDNKYWAFAYYYL